MSLFETRDWWSTSVAQNEEFAERSLALYPPDLIIAGSMQGLFRVFRPRCEEFKIEDLLLETQLDPIHQIETGIFSSFAQNEEVAILHPRKLSIYTLEETGGNCNMNLSYEHKLSRNAFNFTFGPFGDYTG
jgi:Bardet-Biedl syndrome 9 protein